MPSQFHCPVCGTVYQDKGSAKTRDKRWHWCRTGTLDQDHDFVPNEDNTDIVCVRRPTKVSCLAAFQIQKNKRGVWQAVEVNHPRRVGKAAKKSESKMLPSKQASARRASELRAIAASPIVRTRCEGCYPEDDHVP